MKKTAFAFGVAAAALFAAGAASASELNHTHVMPDQGHANKAAGGGGGSNLIYHSPGPVIHSAHVVPIFWGPSWGTGGADAATASHIIQFFGQFGGTTHYAVITQYSDTTGSIQSTNLGNVNCFDGSTPPTNVTDADMQAEVNRYLANQITGCSATFDASAIYEVFIPPGSYSSNGTSTSCGGPSLAYCAYHGHFAGAFGDTKYAAMPYPSCSGCQSSGFTASQNFDHFSCHETREAVTDEDLNAWYDRRGNEADDKCAWSPTPFLDGTDSSGVGFGYQYEWSNAVGGCVK